MHTLPTMPVTRTPAVASGVARTVTEEQPVRSRLHAWLTTDHLVEAPLVLDLLLVLTWAAARLSGTSQLLTAVVVVGSLVALRWPATGVALAGLAFIFPLQPGSLQAGAPLLLSAGLGCLMVAACHRLRLGVHPVIVLATALAATTGLALLRLMVGPLSEIADMASLRWAGLVLGLATLPIHLFLLRLGAWRAISVVVAAAGAAVGLGFVDGLAPHSLDKTPLGSLLSRVAFDRATGPFPSPNRLGTVAAVIAAGAALLAWDRRGRMRTALALGATVATITVVLSYSRGALLGLAVACVLLIARHSVRLAAVAAILGALAIFVVTPAFMNARLGEAPPSSGLPAEQAANDAGRLQAWLAGVRMGLAQPVTGLGYDAYAVVGPQYGGPANLETAHNEAFALFGDAGLPAALSYGGLVAAGAWALRRRSVANDLGLAALLVFVTASSFNIQSVFPQVTTLVWAIVGLGLALGTTRVAVNQAGRHEDGEGDQGVAP